jgi:hypothetical protein
MWSAYSYGYSYPRRQCASSERQWQSDSETDDVFLVSLVSDDTACLTVCNCWIHEGDSAKRSQMDIKRWDMWHICVTATQLKAPLTHSLTDGAEAFLRSRQLCSYSRTSKLFMETEGSLPCSLSWARSIRTIPPYLSKIHFNIVYPPSFWSSQWSLSFWLSHQYPKCVLHALPISSSLTWSF